MISIDTPYKSLQIILTAAKTTTDMDYTVCYYDVPSRTKESTGEYRAGHTDGVTNGTTLVTAVSAPKQNYTRNISHIAINNADSAAKTVIVQIYTSSPATTTRKILKTILNQDQTLVYEEGAGWQII